jgi:hypothetical protein
MQTLLGKPRPAAPVAKLRLAALVAAAALGLAGCTGPQPAPTPSPSVGNDDARTAWLEVARCMRANGHPDYPDPVQDEHGVWNVSYPLAGDSPPACDAAVRRAKVTSRSLSGIGPSEMALRRQYAVCMRSNGIALFPDPDEDGNFGPATEGLRADPAYAAAAQACRDHLPPQRPK